MKASGRTAAPHPADQVRLEACIPDYVAAYAVALHHAGVGSWGTVRVVVNEAGMGLWSVRELAAAGTAWARLNVSPAAKTRLRALAKVRHP